MVSSVVKAAYVIDNEVESRVDKFWIHLAQYCFCFYDHNIGLVCNIVFLSILVFVLLKRGDGKNIQHCNLLFSI